MARSLSLSAMSVMATVARWAAERRGREDMLILRVWGGKAKVGMWAMLELGAIGNE